MIQQFTLNIMYDAWLPVIMEDGTKKEISLYEAIKNSHHIMKIQKFGQNPIEDYSVSAFLFDFVQWVYKPTGRDKDEKQDAITKLFDKGCFDNVILDAYIKEYESAERSFDLFDKKHPFLQMSELEWNRRKPVDKPIPLTSPNFSVNYTSGNSVLFEHGKNYVTYSDYMQTLKKENANAGTESYDSKLKIENIVTLKPVELFASILYCVAYKLANGAGSFSSVSTSGIAHPIFAVCEGENLFETICLSIGVSKSYDAKPLWERDDFIITSTEMMHMDNNVALTYTPTVRIYPCNYHEMYATNLLKGEDFQEVAYNEELKRKDYNTPNRAYAKWIEEYPRILRKRFEDKKGNQSVKAVIYAHENLSAKNPVLETNILQLECESRECDVANINYEVLQDKIDIKIHYYGLAYKNASANSLTCFGKEFIFDKPLNDYAELRLPKFLEFIAIVAKITATHITELDFASKTRKDDIHEIKELTKDKLSANALSETDCIIQQCIYDLGHNKYNDLINEDTDITNDLYDWITYQFFDGFDKHEKYLPRHSLLKYAEASEKYKVIVNGIKNNYKED